MRLPPSSIEFSTDFAEMQIQTMFCMNPYPSLEVLDPDPDCQKKDCLLNF